MEVRTSGYTKGIEDLENDIKATEQTLLAIAEQEPDIKGSVKAAASSLLALLRLKARADAGSSHAGLQLVRDSCMSLLVPNAASSHALNCGPTGFQSHPCSQQHSALLNAKLQECCSVLGSTIGNAAVSQLTAVLESLYTRQLQLLSQCPELPSQAQVPEQPEPCVPARAALLHAGALRHCGEDCGEEAESYDPARAASLQPGASQQPAGQGTTAKTSAQASRDQLLQAHRPAPVAVRQRSLPLHAPNPASAEDTPNLASPVPCGPPSGATPEGTPHGSPHSRSNCEAHPDYDRGLEKAWEWSGEAAAARGAVEVDRHGRIVASAFSHADGATSGAKFGELRSHTRPQSGSDREVALRLRLEEVQTLLLTNRQDATHSLTIACSSMHSGEDTHKHTR